MKRIFAIMAAALLSVTIPGHSQSLDDLNIQIHGYATQGFLYTTNNNLLTTNSSNGSPSWDEAVVNISAQPMSKLRVSVQGRYFVLGNYGNAITLDYAMADYKANDYLGVRFGKVKTPSGLFNENQDIDPSYQWGLLPQSIYPIASRNSLLSHFGGVAYGSVSAGKSLGRFDYRVWAGQLVLGKDDGYFTEQNEAGLTHPNGASLPTVGGTLRWHTPLPGLLVGAALEKNTATSQFIQITNGPSGRQNLGAISKPHIFAQYEKNRLMVAGEYQRLPVSVNVVVAGFSTPQKLDFRSWYGMATYKVTDKLSAGVYHSQQIDRQAALGAARYSKDWAISGRYDFNQFIYAKAEQHFIKGTAIGYDTDMNPGGLKPNTKLTILKVGVSF